MLLLQSMEKRYPAILERVAEFRRTKATESSEVHVMEGARNLIARRTATFIIEVIAQTVDDVLAHFEGYQLFVLNDHLNRVEPYAGNLDRHTNIMLVPR